MRYCIDWVPFS